MNLIFTLIVIAIPVIFFIAKYISNRNAMYLRSFNEMYHIDNAPNELSRGLLEIGAFPFHAFKEKDVDKGIEMDMQFLAKQDEYLDNLSLEQHSELIRGMDNYLMGDISNVKVAKRISKERGYKF